jgi:hypothetical protein
MATAFAPCPLSTPMEAGPNQTPLAAYSSLADGSSASEGKEDVNAPLEQPEDSEGVHILLVNVCVDKSPRCLFLVSR